MALQDNIYLSLMLIACFGIFGYQAYGFWFRPEKARESFIKTTEQSPNWSPLREQALKFAQGKYWIWYNRATSTVVCLLLVVVAIMVYF